MTGCSIAHRKNCSSNKRRRAGQLCRGEHTGQNLRYQIGLNLKRGGEGRKIKVFNVSGLRFQISGMEAPPPLFSRWAQWTASSVARRSGVKALTSESMKRQSIIAMEWGESVAIGNNRRAN